MKYTVAVRSLCEFTARQGDLDTRFTPSATALEGIAGHAMVTSRRGSGYRAEVTLSGEFDQLLVRGRADGYDAERNVLEEIKTFRGDLQRMPANRRALHWAQARVYGWLLCQKLKLDALTVSLVYYDVGTQLETSFAEACDAESLRHHFEMQCRLFIEWAASERRHVEARTAALKELRFPHDGFRPGQRLLAESVYKAATSARTVLAQAPTGIGKTVGTLFPLLKAWPEQALDKIFFLTAKSPGRALALDAMKLIGRGQANESARASACATGGVGDFTGEATSRLPVRVLELVARDKACERPGKACNGESCDLARGFYDRLPAARSEAVERLAMDRTALREVAASHGVCPYYLGQELVRWSDVIVGDYNYYFDYNAMLHGMTLASQWRVAVLVDEAHNLVERGRRMYSATLDRAELAAAIDAAPDSVRPVLDRLHRKWRSIEQSQSADYAVHDEVPEAFASALQLGIAAMSDHLGEQVGGEALAPGSPLLRWHFSAVHFARLLDAFGDHSLLELTLRDDSSTFCLRNVVPASFLRQRFATAHASALFSATLTPNRYYLDMLGVPADTVCIDVPSPFDAVQLRVELVGGVSTRLHDRHDSLVPIAEVMARHFRQRPGNYLAFFSSFDYLQRAARRLASVHPQIPTWQQSPQMDEAERERFIERFREGGSGIGFAVLGGAFGEGIDLPGTRLIGAFIASLGLPPLNAGNEQVRARMQASFGSGYDYTYLYPGIQKVVQAAGRVIRGPGDRGVVVLIDDRYTRQQVKDLLPKWWRPVEATAPRMHSDLLQPTDTLLT